MASVTVFKQLTPAAGVPSSLHTVAAGLQGIYNLNICNRNAATAAVSIAFTLAGTTTYLEYQTPLNVPGNVDNVLERTAFKLVAGTAITVTASVASVDFTLDGIEENV